MITVFTPTYNRAYTLKRLYESLQDQTFRDFEWLVVDDGSTDDTQELLADMQDNATFPMRVFRQENLGKHIAINLGAREAAGEWFFIVDSDDSLPPESLALNESYLEEISGDATFAGVSGVCARADGSLLLGPGGISLGDQPAQIRSLFKLEYIDATPQDYRVKYKMPGDRAEVIRTDIARDIIFPHFRGERFVSEGFLWQAISDRGLRLRWFNVPTYCGDYLQDGLTNNSRAVAHDNPLGRSFVDNYIIGSTAPLKTKLHSAINYTRYGHLGGKTFRDLWDSAVSKPFFLLGYLPGLAYPVKGADHD